MSFCAFLLLRKPSVTDTLGKEATKSMRSTLISYKKKKSCSLAFGQMNFSMSPSIFSY